MSSGRTDRQESLHQRRRWRRLPAVHRHPGAGGDPAGWRPPTRKQEQLITKLVKDFSNVKTLPEYADYTECPTKANASALVTMAMEGHWDEVRTSDGYARYIATRPRAERFGQPRSLW